MPLPKTLSILAVLLVASLELALVHSYYYVQEEEVKFYLNTRQVFDLQLTKDNLCQIDANNKESS